MESPVTLLVQTGRQTDTYQTQRDRRSSKSFPAANAAIPMIQNAKISLAKGRLTLTSSTDCISQDGQQLRSCFSLFVPFRTVQLEPICHRVRYAKHRPLAPIVVRRGMILPEAWPDTDLYRNDFLLLVSQHSSSIDHLILNLCICFSKYL